MQVKVTLNKASLRVDDKLVRQINGKPQNTKRLVRRFEKSGIPQRWADETTKALNHVHSLLMRVFRGQVTPELTSVTEVFGYPLRQPWRPLSWEYMAEKQFDGFWRESGALLQYVSEVLSPISGKDAVRKVEVYPGKVPRGAKTVRVSVLVTPARLPEPLQTLVMYPFLQGRGTGMKAMGDTDVQTVKLLANHALRGFIPDIASAVGKQLLDELRS